MASNQRELVEEIDDINELLDRVGEEHLPSGTWPRTLAELFDVLLAEMGRLGKSEKEAARIARASVIAIAHNLGGRAIYLPRGESVRRAIRDARMWHEHDGRNTQELAERYHLSIRQVYQILSEQKALRMDRKQSQLFSEQ